MKPHDPKPASTAATTPQQHHTQAAEHFEQASKSHKEAAKHLGSNDPAAASQVIGA
jgi:hypothetical protein